VTNEHVWPSRFEKYVPKPPRSTVIYRHDRGPDHQIETSHFATSFDAQVRVVCARCNSGWMASLDAEVESIVSALMRGTAVSLGADGQKLLTLWSLKVAYVAEFLHESKLRHIPPENRRSLLTGVLPPDTFVHVAAYSGSCIAWHRLRTFDIREKRDPTRVVGKGCAQTFILGRLAIRVVSFPGANEWPSEVRPERIVWVRQLYPSSTPFLDLPPIRPLEDDDDLYAFTDELP
jgi:hypothetical protein